jgi:nucleotide-binding universal stress UspA family protein
MPSVGGKHPVIVGFDGSEVARDALRLGSLLAQAAGAPLHAVWVPGQEARPRHDGERGDREARRRWNWPPATAEAMDVVAVRGRAFLHDRGGP